MGEKTSIKDVFVQCQSGMQSHGKLISTLTKIYNKTEFPSFWSEFCHYLKYAMIIFKREPAVERLIDFVAKFVPALSKKSTREEEEDDGNESDHDDVSDNKLLQEMFDFLLQSHSAKDRGVRFRCCQLINKLLTNLGEDAQIDDELYDRLYECMLERLKDKWPVVRYHAVMAMSRLQDPSDENCPVIKAYLFLLNCDPNPDVRRAVLTSIAPSTKTLSTIVGRTRDVKDTVRKVAYEVLAEKINIKALSIALRLQLVNEGLNDRSETVKAACSGKLIQAWLRTFGGNILDLLKSLDVEDSTDVCSLILETLFKTSSPQDLVERFDILNESLLVPMDQLTCESALYWQAVCKYFHGMGNEGDEFMDKVLPTCVDYCSFVQSYIDDLKTIDDPEIQLSREFIIEHLLVIASYMDTADQASRKALENLLHNMLMADHVSHRLVKPIATRICELRGPSEALIPYLAETVSEIREPISVVAKDIAAEEQRQINLKIAGIRVQLNQLREDLDEAVKVQDFEKANAIKTQVAELDAEKARLLETTETTTEEVRTERNDPATILKCQTIITEMLRLLKLSTVSPTLQMMIESQILPGIQNEDVEVRNVAMQALGLCCYLSKDQLVSYIPLFMQASQIDVEGIRVTALRVLFDLLHIYGLEIVDANDGSSDENSTASDSGETNNTPENKSSDKNGAASKLVAIICSFLDGDNSELRACAAEGLAKLLLSGRIVSAKILSHLILLWYNPLSEDDTHLRDCLGTFFPVYALAGRSNQEVVEEAFLPTLKTLLNAPASSPLAEVDVNNVAELLVQLTNTKLITQNQKPDENSQMLSVTEIGDNPGHDNLSEKVCNEILSNPESSTTKLWVKILNQMEISPDNEVVLKDLRILCYKMVKLVKERVSLKSLQKFQSTINEMASKFVTNEDDLENIEIEPVAPMETEGGEDTEEELAEDSVPKKKRVRKLHSQNLTMTLGLDSESELDISQADTTEVEVDASCLERRTSAVSTASETPSRRCRKNTASSVVTEIAGEDDVFCIPEAPPVSRKRISLGTKQTDKEEEVEEAGDGEDEETGTTNDKEEADGVVSGSQDAVVVLEDVFRTSGKPAEREAAVDKTTEDKTDKSADQASEHEEKEKADKKRKTPTKANKKSPVKDKENVPDKTAEKDKDGEADVPRRSLEKRRKSRGESDEELPAKSPKRPDKSPAKSPKRPDKSPAKSPRRLDRSPAKSPRRGEKSSAKSPRGGEKSPAKSPRRGEKSPAKSPRRQDKSPAKAKDTVAKSPGRSVEKRKSKGEGAEVPSKSPRRGTDRSPSADETSPEKQKDKAAVTKPTRKSSDKSPEKAAPKPEDGAGKTSTRRSTDKQKEAAPKSPIKRVQPVPKTPERILEKRKGRTDEIKQTLAKSPRIALVKSPWRLNKETAEKSPRKTLDKAPAKQKTDEMKKKTNAFEPRKGVRNAVAKPSVEPPKNTRNTRKDAAKSPAKEKEASNVDGSPKSARRSVTQMVAAENQEPKSPRATRRSSQVVLDTPEPKSPSSLRGRPQRSIAETPELKSPKQTRKPVDKAPNQINVKPISKAVEKETTKATDMTKSGLVNTSTRNLTRTASASTARTEKEKPGLEAKGKTRGVTRSASTVERTTRTGMTSSDEAVSPVNKKKKIVREEPPEEDSEEEPSLKRKAKPSRKSLTGGTFRSPALSTRSTPARREITSSQEDKRGETPSGRGRGSSASTPSAMSSKSPSSVSSSAATSSQSSIRPSTRRSAVEKMVATPRSESDDSVFSTPGSTAPRTRGSQQAAGDANKRSTRSKLPAAPVQEKKVRDAGKRVSTKTLPSRAKTTRK